MYKTAIHHIEEPAYRNPFGAVTAGCAVTLRVDAAEPAVLRIWFNNEEKLLQPTDTQSVTDGYTRYTFVFTPSQPGLFWYRFIFPNCALVPDETGLHGCIADLDAYESFQLTVYDPNFTVPTWTEGSVMMQIFPDRFAKAHTDTALPDRIYRDWGEPITFAPLPGEKLYTGYDFYGGNLAGITEHLDYLSDMGVTLLYLNPVFFAASNHRYDVCDYETTDPVLGTPEEFRILCEKAKAKNIRVICDGVFSHTGDNSRYFDRHGHWENPGACQSKDSPFYPWYRFRHWPDTYECWWGFTSLPEVNEDDPSFNEYINGKDGIAALWLRRGASGWRLDVADELPDVFLDNFRRAVKSVNPDALILGEVWEDASRKVAYGQMRHYLLGSQLDSVMNYPFRRWMIDLCMNRITPTVFRERVLQLLSNYPAPCIGALMNFLSTHDTIRIRDLLSGMPEDITREDAEHYVYTDEQLTLGLKRLRAAMMLLFTLPGMPCVFYGDELGMLGGPDPLCRRTFPPSGFQMTGELQALYAKLAKLRREPALAKGGTELFAEGCMLRIVRRFETQTAELILDTNRYDCSLKCGSTVIALRY